MSYTKSLRVEVKVRAPQTGDQYTPGSDAGAIDFSRFLNSTAITKRFHKTYNVAASSSTNVDFYGGAAGIGGNGQNWSTVKFILVRNLSTSATKACKVGWSSNGLLVPSAAGTIPCNPVFVFMNESGTAVTADTGDIFTLYNDDASAAADIEIIACGT